MKNIAVAVALMFGLAALAVGTPADAKGMNNARYAACVKKHAKRYSFSPGWIWIADHCYFGRLGY
jgi:hypothetical protein